ncbi:MAG: UvrD-helicase domain-containing protein [Candidatus Methylomirabilis sp.]
MKRYLCIGPPGTGKTFFGQGLVAEFINQGTPPDQIAYVAFTKAAAYEAAKRCGIWPEESRDLWFRTLHSACYKLAGDPRPNVMTSKLVKQFSERIGLEMTLGETPGEESLEELYWRVLRKSPNLQRDGDQYLRAYDLSRLCCRSASDLEQARAQQHFATLRTDQSLDPGTYRAFVEAYEEFKSKDGVVDYIDMLTRVLEGRCEPVPKWKLAVIDECQDLAPLMHAVVDRLWGDAEWLFRIGDDMQAIYTFMMSSAADFLQYRKGSKLIILQQTYRFGKEIVDLAARIADRVEDKIPRTVLPKDGVTNEIRVDYEFNPEMVAAASAGRRCLVLHRHIAGCRSLGERLTQAGIPFWNERGVNPLARTNEKNTWAAFKRMHTYGHLTQDELLALLSNVPSRTTVESEAVQLVRHGAKKKIRESFWDESKLYQHEQLKEIFTDTFLESVRQNDPRWLQVQYREYYDALEQRGFDLARGEPSIVVTTVHGAKGREADPVVLFSETFPKAFADAGEHRVPYVGVTRTKRDLWIMREPIVGDWTKEYPYPIFEDPDEKQ